MSKKYVQYGCGLSAPKEWINFDSSISLRIQKVPILKYLLKSKLKTKFPENVRYGDIAKGLPVEDSSCYGVYCSHILEHLSLDDFQMALKNTYRILKDDGIFRCIVPDLEWEANNYIKELKSGNKNAAFDFLHNISLGIKNKPKGLKETIIKHFSNSQHLWMWDYFSLEKELLAVGFKEIRKCTFKDSEDRMFDIVENEYRFINSIAVQCKK